MDKTVLGGKRNTEKPLCIAISPYIGLVAGAGFELSLFENATYCKLMKTAINQ